MAPAVWQLSRYADVAAALVEPGLSGGGDSGSDGVHVRMREAARRAFSPERMAEWKREMTASANALVQTLPAGEAVDLVADLAAPWSLAVAGMVTGAPPKDLPRLAALACEVFTIAAFATTADTPQESREPSTELARALSTTDQTGLIGVQAFVALSQTLPCFLGAAWLALLRHPDELARLTATGALMPGAVEELLRFAGPSRAVFRRAVADVHIGDAHVNADDHVVLMVSAANRDPARFANPDCLDLNRDATGHLSFGRGTHFCSGASLVRLALAVATTALLDAFPALTPTGSPTWIDGFAIRGLASLPAVLSP